MGFFKKDNKLIKNENMKDSKKLSKYLPSLLFVSTQRDINEKALKSYITSIAKSSFDNLNEVKYSIKKVGKNEYLYEIHNGSRDLTYLNLVHKSFYQEANNEVILKASNQNVKVIKRSNGKLESVLLLESKNRDDEAVVDYNTTGSLKEIVKEGTAFFMFSTLFFAVSGILAASSFFTKYYMLNEDYSLDLNIKNIESPRSYVSTVDVSSHSKYHYIKNITFNSVKGWNVDYVNIEPPVVEEPLVEEVISENIEVQNNVDLATVQNSNVDTPSEEVIENTPAVDNKELNINESLQNNIKDPVVEEMVIESKANVESFEIEEPKVQKNDENKEEYIILESTSDNVINTIEPQTELKEEKEVIGNRILEVEEIHDEFEIIDESNINNLDLSNLPDNIVLEEGEK